MKKKMGVTLVELLIALVCMVVMLGVVYQLILITERIRIRTGARVEAEYNIRETFGLMVSELRHAGYRHWDMLDSNPASPNFAFKVNSIGTDSSTSTITFEGDLNESGDIERNEHITYEFGSNTRTLRRGIGTTIPDWETVANNIENVQFTYRDFNGIPVNLPAISTDVTNNIRSIEVAFVFAYPIKGEGKTLTTTINTNVRLRNTYYQADVNNLLK